MASNYTSNYALNQWSAEDRVLREEFNTDNAKTDAALAELAQEVNSKASQEEVTGIKSVIATKADQSALSSLSTTVAAKANQSDLDSLSTTVAGKANQSALNTVSSNLSSLTTTVGTKASQSDLNNLKTTVNTKANQSDLTALTTTVGTKASQSDLTALSNLVAKKGNCTITTGSYVGNGKYDAQNPNKLVFSSRPLLVIITAPNSALMSGQAESGTAVASYYGARSIFYSWSGNTLSWYSSQSSSYQLNESGVTYYYLTLFTN